MSARSEAVVRSLGFLFEQGTHCGLSDSELLERFRSHSGDAAAHAFEGLVLRHGPMVFDVCNKVLDNPHDAQDAFQATFLVLATRARSIRRQGSVGSWLHGIALRVARRARSDAARRQAHERRSAGMSDREGAVESLRDDGDFLLLHEEVERLPRMYREPVVLCYLEGLSLEAAAAQLGCPVSTLGVRLMRARHQLKARLTRRGVSRADGLLVAGPAAGTGSAVLPGSLVRTTVSAAVRIAAGGTVSIAATALTHSVLRSMAMVRLAQVVVGCLVAIIGVASLGAALRPEAQAAAKPASPPAGRVPESWVGKKVVIKYAAPLMEEGRVVHDGKEFRVYTVDRIDGERAKLVADGVSWLAPELHNREPAAPVVRRTDGVSGWVNAADIVLLDRAIDFYTREIQANGRNTSARLRRAMVREYQDQRARAIADLSEAIAIEPNNAELRTVRGMMLGDDFQINKAIADLTEAIRLDPKSMIAHRERGRYWVMEQEMNKAVADFTEVLRLDPRNEFAFRERGLAWSVLGENDKVIADFSEVIKMAPNDAEAYVQRGGAWTRKEDDDKAIADLTRAIQLDPNTGDAYRERGAAWLWKKKDSSKAIADSTEAIRLDPRDSLAHDVRGVARQAGKDFDGAIADFTEAIRLDPQDPLAYEHRGGAWYDKGDHNRAIADFTEAIRLDPKSFKSHLYRGLAFHAKELFARAITDYDEAVRLDPKHPEAYGARAWIWANCPDANLRDGQRAVKSATKACELTEWKVATHLATLAAASAEVDDYDSAIKWQTRANALYTNPADKKAGEILLESFMESFTIQAAKKAVAG